MITARSIDMFFGYAREREAIRRRRLIDPEGPWTSDPVLRQYRFCNIFREDDTVTQWIREHIREPLHDSPHVLMAMVIARFINRVSTLEPMAKLLRQEPRASFDTWALRRARYLSVLRDCQPPIVTGAYMVKTPPGMDKIDGLMWIFDQIAGDAEHLCARIHPGETTLRSVHRELTRYRYLGSFMAYEIVTDLRHTSWLSGAPDIMSWAAVGPGAARGLGRLCEGGTDAFSYTSPAAQEVMLGHMQFILQMSRNRKLWPQKWGRWEMRDVEHTLCEYDKYQRAVTGEGTPKQKRRTA